MKQRKRVSNALRAVLSVLSLFSMMETNSMAEEPQPRSDKGVWDTYSDTWVATDILGRKLPTYTEVGPPRKDRFVGIFYFLWLGAHVTGGPYDISKILHQDPDAMQKTNSPLWGPMHVPHHWGESLFGYYLSDDAYVLRKHALMLANAGVDTLIFDVTNQHTYKQYYMPLLREFSEVRKNGNTTPQVAFLCPFGDPPRVVAELYNDLYGPGLYKDLWFPWEGKPLILADPAKVDPKFLPFFTFRKPQPDYFQGPTGPDMWSWLEIYPQHVFKNSKGEKEQMAVGVAQNAIGKRLGTLSEPGASGRNYHNGANDKSPNAVLHGYNVAEQWEHALKEDPKFLFLTGWNEWYGGRFNEFIGVKMPVMFVDTFNQEFSRDIEPMKGGHGDVYYYQMVSYIRRYKGVRKPPAASPPKTIQLDGDFRQWEGVAPEFRAPVGDTANRDHPGYNNVARYVNKTGRNDFVAMKVARDKENLYFYVRAKDPITPRTDPNWMLLFLDVDSDRGTGWEGYDFIVNRTVVDGMTTTLEAHGGGWNWVKKADARYRVQGNEMMLTIKRADLGLTDGSKPLQIDFKWADNLHETGSIDSFTLYGDSAPPGRFNYRYTEEAK